MDEDEDPLISKLLMMVIILAAILLISFLVTSSASGNWDPEITIKRVERWRWLLEDYREGIYPKLDVDLILALIAQESYGVTSAVADDHWGSTGLMQVGPRSWVATREELLDPYINIAWGLWFWQQAYMRADGDQYTALRIYNCGPDRAWEVETCGSFYANRILDYWLPMFRTRFNNRIIRSDWALCWWGNGVCIRR